MPKFVIERQYLVPMCQHIVVEAESLEEASRGHHRTAGVDPMETFMTAAADRRLDQEAAIHSGSSPAHVSASSSAFASFRSAVPKPSVNQP
jgi:hypothetical protein